ncbi:MAG: DUF1559 domain-containing protein, partial [Lentisphaeria bacterium]|nr:DUF1559 domain-containing protein [Lentisphaeria bacterium]
AILAAILLPALNSARERGRAASCINNLKQFGTALPMYGEDNDGYSCYGWADNNSWCCRVGFHMFLGTYMGGGNTHNGHLVMADADNRLTSTKNDIFLCSSLPYEENWREGGWSTSYWVNITYNDNQHIGFFGAQNYCTATKLTRISNPSQGLGIGEGVGSLTSAINGFVNCMSWSVSYAADSANAKAYFPGRHSGSDNVMFMDSHVAANKWVFPVKGTDPIMGKTLIK